jgi:hypothetical protein
MVLVLAVGAGFAAPPTHPSDRSCLIAWNAPANHANRARLLAAGPTSGLSLRGGRSYTYTWTKTTSRQSSSEACLLMLHRAGMVQLVTGRWHDGRVERWAWGRVGAATTALTGAANVRLLPDGRLTKVYSR